MLWRSAARHRSVGVLRELLGENLQSDVALELGVAGAEHLAHAAGGGYISTLRRVLESMGGRLRVLAEFPGGEVVAIDQFDGDGGSTDG